MAGKRHRHRATAAQAACLPPPPSPGRREPGRSFRPRAPLAIPSPARRCAGASKRGLAAPRALCRREAPAVTEAPPRRRLQQLSGVPLPPCGKKRGRSEPLAGTHRSRCCRCSDGCSPKPARRIQRRCAARRALLPPLASVCLRLRPRLLLFPSSLPLSHLSKYRLVSREREKKLKPERSAARQAPLLSSRKRASPRCEARRPRRVPEVRFCAPAQSGEGPGARGGRLRAWPRRVSSPSCRAAQGQVGWAHRAWQPPTLNGRLTFLVILKGWPAKGGGPLGRECAR